MPLVIRALDAFTRSFHRTPTHAAVAPGRVNLIGEHTDYNGGFVLPMAIERRTICAGALTDDGRWHVRSGATDDLATGSIAALDGPDQPAWANYVRGVLATCGRAGIRVPGIQLVVESDVPLGGGLSSSAALEVATATLLEALTGTRLAPMDKARLCQRAEHEFAGVPCGVMDQAVVSIARSGHALLLDCRSGDVEHVAMDDPSVAILIVNTNVRHELAAGEYARRRVDCEEAARQLGVPALRDATLTSWNTALLPDRLRRRARHVISENARTREAVDALRARDWPRMGQLMYESHASLRDDYDVSCVELDVLVDAARTIGESGGVWGCRMTGGGFGGCVVALVDRSRATAVAARLETAYHARTNIEASSFVTTAADGAHAIPLIDQSSAV